MLLLHTSYAEEDTCIHTATMLLLHTHYHIHFTTCMKLQQCCSCMLTKVLQGHTYAYMHTHMRAYAHTCIRMYCMHTQAYVCHTCTHKHSVTSSYIVSRHHTQCHAIIHSVTSSYIVSHKHTYGMHAHKHAHALHAHFTTYTLLHTLYYISYTLLHLLHTLYHMRMHYMHTHVQNNHVRPPASGLGFRAQAKQTPQKKKTDSYLLGPGWGRKTEEGHALKRKLSGKGEKGKKKLETILRSINILRVATYTVDTSLKTNNAVKEKKMLKDKMLEGKKC